MSCYRSIKENAEKVEAFPIIDAQKWEKKINRLFTAYVFFRRKRDSIEIWTGCCGEHRIETWIKQTMTTGDYEIRTAKHNERGACPFCGRRATYKEFRHLGKRKGLREYRAVVILSASGGDLYARAYWCRKSYEELTEAPKVYAPSVYRFSIRERSAEQYEDPQGDCFCIIQKEKYNVKKRAITEPFTKGGYCFSSYAPYKVLNPAEIDRSDFRYCQYDSFAAEYDYKREGKTDLYLMRFLTIAAIYPDKVEMLLKNGLGELVADLVCNRKKHSVWFDWDAIKFKDAFKGITRQQLREIAEMEIGMRDVDLWAEVRNQGISLPELYELCQHNYRIREVAADARRNRIAFKDMVRYLEKQGKRERRRDRIDGQYALWKDYVQMAGELGWTLAVRSVLLPPDLRARHDEALKEVNAKHARERLERERERIGALDELRKKNEKKMEARRKKYNFEMDGFVIRIAESGEEIIREGLTLGHCVGGYAERHLNGTTSILFLRRQETPEASLYTIEMHGDTMYQIHGFRNDTGFSEAQKPINAMKWMLEPWTEWLKQGSPRDKDGKPLLPEKKEEVKTA